MGTLLRSFLTVLFVLTISGSSLTNALLSKTAVVTNLKIRVRVYNMARVPARVLAEAEQEVARIFVEAGVRVEWLECPCAQNPSSADLMLRIIPQLFGSMRADFREDHLGFAPSSEEGGVLATIFFHRVEVLTRGGATAPLLGNAIAHELGHLLLGSNAHSRSEEHTSE